MEWCTPSHQDSLFVLLFINVRQHMCPLATWVEKVMSEQKVTVCQMVHVQLVSTPESKTRMVDC